MRRPVRVAGVVACCLAFAFAASAASAELATLPGAAPLDPALAKRLAAAEAKLPREDVRTEHRDEDGAPRYTNRLILEQSPYLLQHAHNPVNWHPWGDEAFATAKRLGRPVLLSIGYATCHWCHVMEEESFDDLEIAELLNESFVAIKVDREVRPDVDATYMTAIQLLGERGGWPLNVFLTPDREPFHAGTYFPPEDRHGRPGFPRVLAALRDLYAKDPDRVAKEAARVTAALREVLAPATAGEAALPERELIDRALAGYARRYDEKWGGIATRTKFPGALPIPLLLRADGDGDPDGVAMASHTLEVMARSGLRDHVGGGFHRYTTDPRWQIPHFEKMLYDNARMTLAYLEAWQKTGRADFAEVARDTASMMLRDFAAEGGGFHSASDADSAGPDGELEEGRYFTWTREELASVLGADDAAIAAHWYDVGVDPLLAGRSVLRTPHAIAAAAKRAGMSEAAFRDRLARIRARLLEVRAQRPPPLVDRKVLTAWNGLAISALARTGFALGEASFVEAAAGAARVVLAGRDEAGRLRRVRFQGEASGVAFLEDYALMIAALLDLYESEGESRPEWLAAAIALQERQDADFGDAAGGGWFRTAAESEAMLVRDKPFVDDGTVPAGNGVAVSNLLRLAALTAEEAFLARADRAFAAFAGALEEEPIRAPTLLTALDWRRDVAQEVIVVLPGSGSDGAALLDVLRRVHQPNRVVAVVREGASQEANAEWVSLVSGKKASRGEPTAYVCENRTCRFPTRDPAELERQLLRQSEADRATR